jgi:hypothetical protein
MPNVKLSDKIMTPDKIIHIKQYNRDYYKNIGILRKYNKKIDKAPNKEVDKTKQTNDQQIPVKKIVDKIIVTF